MLNFIVHFKRKGCRRWFVFYLLVAFAVKIPLACADVLTEVKAAYFRPTSDTFRDIYSTRGIYGFEVSGRVWDQLYVFGGGDYFHTSGSSLKFHQKSTITLAPLAVGLKYFFPTRKIDYYLGAGIIGSYVHIHDYSSYVVQSNSNWSVGGVFKGGALYNITSHLFFDVFVNYMVLEADFPRHGHLRVYRHQADLSGLIVGLGFGYRFGTKFQRK